MSNEDFPELQNYIYRIFPHTEKKDWNFVSSRDGKKYEIVTFRNSKTGKTIHLFVDDPEDDADFWFLDNEIIYYDFSANSKLSFSTKSYFDKYGNIPDCHMTYIMMEFDVDEKYINNEVEENMFYVTDKESTKQYLDSINFVHHRMF